MQSEQQLQKGGRPQTTQGAADKYLITWASAFPTTGTLAAELKDKSLQDIAVARQRMSRTLAIVEQLPDTPTNLSSLCKTAGWPTQELVGREAAGTHRIALVTVRSETRRLRTYTRRHLCQ